jgi:hypothetical protein
MKMINKRELALKKDEQLEDQIRQQKLQIEKEKLKKKAKIKKTLAEKLE